MFVDRVGFLLAPRPLLPVALAFVTGLKLGVAVPEPILLLASAATLSLVLLALLLGRPRRPFALALLAAGAALVGVALARAGPPRAEAELAAWVERLGDRPVLVRGRPVGLVRSTRMRIDPRCAVDFELESLELRGIRLPLEGRVLLLAEARARPLLSEAGRVEAWVRLRRPVGERNFGRPAHPRRIETLAISTAAELLEPLPGRRPGLDRWRERVASTLRGAGRTRPLGAGLARALVLGERDELDEELRERLRAGGTAHVLAVSGLHVALVTWAVAGLAARLGARRRSQGLAALVTAWAFAGMAGFGVPVLRAAALVSGFAAARILGRGLDRWNALASAVLLSGLLRPGDVLGAGWSLTFGATAGLMLLTRPIARLAGRPRHVPAAVFRDALSASLAAWLALLPLQLSYFGRVNPLAPVLNLLAVPTAGLATVLSGLLSLAGLVSTRLATWGIELVELAARLLGFVDASGLALDTGPVGGLVGGLWTAALCFWALARDPRLRFAALLLALLCGRELLSGWTRGLQPGVDAAVTVLDVGQGSATLVELRRTDGRTHRLLVDAGGHVGSGRDIGETVVVPALRALGVRRLDAVLLSHADHDHRGGLPAVVRALRPDRVVAGPVPDAARGALADSWAASEEVGARWGLVAAADRLAEGLEVSWPPREPARRLGLSGNDLSVVLGVELSGRRLALLPGDVEQAAERLLKPERVDLLIVAHHGSRTSSSQAFLDAAGPRAAAISAGPGSRHGHPHPEVVERLEEAGIASWTTGRAGAIRFEWRGRILDVTLAGSAGGGVLALDGPRAACHDAPP